KGKLGEKLTDLDDGLKKDDIKADKNACTRAKKEEDFYKKKPAAKDAPNLIFNAGLDYVKCGHIPDAIAAYMVVLSKFPASPGAKDALLDVAKLQENRLELAQAATMFARFAQKYPKEKESVAALAKACELSAALNAEGAVNTCLAFAGT